MLEIEKSKGVIEQVSKLNRRTASLSDVKMSLIDYILKGQVCYNTHAIKIKNETNLFQETIAKKSFYSIGKIQPMKNLIAVYKGFIIYVENAAQVNIAEIKRIDCNTSKQQQKVKVKSEGFIKSMEDYIKSQQAYNKMYGDYSSNCNKLNEMMEKFMTYENPINFYNLHMTSDYSKKLDKKYQTAQNTEASLITNLQILDPKRKLLSQNLQQIKQCHVFLVQSHMKNIQNVSRVLTDKSKDEFCKICMSSKNINEADGDMFKEQIERFDDKYGKIQINQDDLLKDLKELFKDQNQNIHISSDYKLFLDRCEAFRDKKCQSVQQSLFLQKKMLEQIQRQADNCQKLEKDFHGVERQIFKSNGTTEFKRKIKQYFGSDVLQISQLCLLISESHRKRFQKIGKIFKSKVQKLKKIFHSKDDEMKKFKKRISLILDQHDTAKQTMVSPGKMSIASVHDFKESVKKSFQNFRKVVEEFSRHQKEIDNSFIQCLLEITEQIKKQAMHSLLSHILSKEKQKMKYNVLQKINIDNEVIAVVKDDSRYQVLFNQSLAPNLYDSFHTLIKKKNYEETKKVLRKKEYQQKNMFGQKMVGCCGILESKNKVSKNKAFSEHYASIVYENDIKKGLLHILPKGVTFEEKSKNPFSSKIEVMIPIKDIIGFSTKTKNQLQGIQIVTNMGTIIFISEQSTQIEESLQKNIGNKIKDVEIDKKQKYSVDTSSFNKNNNSSTEFKITYESGNFSKDIGKPKKSQSDGFLLKQLAEKWKTMKFLSEQFKSTKEQKSNGSSRQDYQYEDQLCTLLFKQKREGKVSLGANSYLFLDYQWKITFPNMPMLKSFKHGQNIRIELFPNSVKIIIIQLPHEQSYLFIRKKIYSEIQKMNKNLCDFIVNFCQREGNIIIEQQKAVEEESSMNIDGEHFIGEKDQALFRNNSRGASRLLTNTFTDYSRGQI